METWPHHTSNAFIQIDWHYGFFWPVPPDPFPVPGGALHLAGADLTLPLSKMGEDKSNKQNILADGVPIVSRAHECKYLIVPHMNIPFTPMPGINVTIPLLIFGSSSKCEFAVGSVRGTDGPIAVSVFKAVGLNWSCQGFAKCDTLAPLCAVQNSSTVVIGFTWGDLVASLICGVFDAAKTALESFVIGESVGWLVKNGSLKSQVMKGVLHEKELDLIAEVISGLAVIVYSNVVGGPLGDSTGINKTFNSNVYSGMLTGSTVTNPNGFANHMGALVDGNAELLAL